MKKQSLSASYLVMLVYVVLQFAGCSIIGFTVGTLSEAGKPDLESIPLSRMESIKRGSAVKVITKTGTVSGELIGIEDIPMEEYRASYDSVRSAIMPALGDTIILTTTNNRSFEERLIGFKPEFVLLSATGPMPDSNFVGSVYLNVAHVAKLSDSRGNILGGEQLRKLMNAGDIPFMSSVVLKTENHPVRIPLDNVTQVEVKYSKNMALNGFLIGAAIDVGLIVAAFLFKNAFSLGISGSFMRI